MKKKRIEKKRNKFELCQHKGMKFLECWENEKEEDHKILSQIETSVAYITELPFYFFFEK